MSYEFEFSLPNAGAASSSTTDGLSFFSSSSSSPAPDIMMLNTPSHTTPAPALQPQANTHGSLYRKPASLPLAVESLEMSDLMRNPHVAELNRRYTQASNTALEAMQTNCGLMKEIMGLKAELYVLKESRGNSEVRIGGTAGGVLEGSSRDSHPKKLIRPAERPAHLPVSVLWTTHDYKSDPNVQWHSSNPSRISMGSALRTEDGLLIDSELYETIRSYGQMLIQQNLTPLHAPEKAKKVPEIRTMSWYKSYLSQDWYRTVEAYEEAYPLLALCFKSWKAEHMLGSILTSQMQCQKRRNKDKVSSSFSSDSTDFASSDPSSDVPSPAVPPSKRPKLQINVDTANSSSEPSPIPSTGTVPIDPAILAQDAAHMDLLGINGTPNSCLTQQPNSSRVDIEFITISSSYESLLEILAEDYPHISAAKSLLSSMKADPDFQRGTPSKDVTDFVLRIENANPNDPSIDEDDKGFSWGHAQFTGGGMTFGSVLTSWAAIGSTDMARRLLAAAIRTSKVAHYVCEQLGMKSTATAYLSDTYLELLVEKLCDLWKTAKTASSVTTSTPPNEPFPILPPSANGASNSSAGVPLTIRIPSSSGAGENGGKTENRTALEQLLQILQKPELHDWLTTHNVKLEGSASKQRSKPELIQAIINDPNCPKPTKDDVDARVRARVTNRKKTAGVR